MRLIDADELIPMIKYATTDSEVGIFPIKIGFDAIKKVVDEAPTIEAEPIRHGHWINHGSYFTCSVCGEEQYGIDNRRYYCQNCGAKMDEANDG